MILPVWLDTKMFRAYLFAAQYFLNLIVTIINTFTCTNQGLLPWDIKWA